MRTLHSQTHIHATVKRIELFKDRKIFALHRFLGVLPISLYDIYIFMFMFIQHSSVSSVYTERAKSYQRIYLAADELKFVKWGRASKAQTTRIWDKRRTRLNILTIHRYRLEMLHISWNALKHIICICKSFMGAAMCVRRSFNNAILSIFGLHFKHLKQDTAFNK